MFQVSFHAFFFILPVLETRFKWEMYFYKIFAIMSWVMGTGNEEKDRKMNRKQEIIHTLLLVLAAFIWGTAFVAQSVGSGIVGPFTFLACRGWIGLLFLAGVIRANDTIQYKRMRRALQAGAAGAASGSDVAEIFRPVTKAQWKSLLLGSLFCGLALFFAQLTQQVGIAHTTTAKSSFITALYCIIVPVLSVFLGHRPHWKVWICVVMGVIGLYLLCMKPGEIGFGFGDLLTLISSFLFAVQILIVDHVIKRVDGIRLSAGQLFIMAFISTWVMIFVERPGIELICQALPSLIYAGVFSSGIAFTLQIIAQQGLNPTIASLAMCLESVFGALAGWALQGQSLAGRELFGCVLMFAAIVYSQVDLKSLKKKGV